jgi:hypothetical protein
MTSHISPRRMERYLFLDDVRPAPMGWVPVRTPADFVYMVTHYDWAIVSFDNDLSAQHTDITGRKLLHWMFDEGLLPQQKPRVHSGDIIAAPLMKAFIEERWPAVLQMRRRR